MSIENQYRRQDNLQPRVAPVIKYIDSETDTAEEMDCIESFLYLYNISYKCECVRLVYLLIYCCSAYVNFSIHICNNICVSNSFYFHFSISFICLILVSGLNKWAVTCAWIKNVKKAYNSYIYKSYFHWKFFYSSNYHLCDIMFDVYHIASVTVIDSMPQPSHNYQAKWFFKFHFTISREITDGWAVREII